MAVEQEKALQELRYSDERKKVDGFALFGTQGAKDIMDANTGERDLEYIESKPMYDLRKSLAWDSAFSSSPGFLEPEELFNTLHSGQSQNGCDILGDEEHQLLSAKYLEPDNESVTDEFNLRKSSAWDSAFFTAEGILNPEELSLVNKGLKKSEIQILPRIEELRVSSESNCTIENDGTSLASLEVELFENIRASTHQVTEASCTAVSSIAKERYRNIQKVNATRNVEGEVVPEPKVKFKPASIRQSINGNVPERIAKVSVGSILSDSSSPLKPPKKRGTNIPMAPANRVHLVSNEASVESKIVRATNGKFLTKLNRGKTCTGDPSSTRSSEKSSLSFQSAMNESKVLCSPYSQFSTCRSSLKSSAVKNDTINVNYPACSSSLTRPCECRITNQITPENCGPRAFSYSETKYPCTSPSVSSDSCSPMSSTSTDHICHNSVTTVNKHCRKSCTDSDASAQSDLEVQPHGQSSEVKGSKCSPSTCTEVKGSNSVSSDASRIMKPSGLRMPSPKIGFFDVDDSLVPAENGVRKLHSGVQNAVSNGGACSRNANGNAIRSRQGKIQTAQILKDIRTTKKISQQTRGSLIPGTMKDIRPFPGFQSSKRITLGREEQGELHWEEKSKDFLRNYEKKVNASATEHEFEVESCARTAGRGAQESTGNKMIRDREDQYCGKGKRLVQRELTGAKDIYAGNDPHMLHDSEKENLIRFENTLEGLREQVRTLDVSGDVVIEF